MLDLRGCVGHGGSFPAEVKRVLFHHRIRLYYPSLDLYHHYHFRLPLRGLSGMATSSRGLCTQLCTRTMERVLRVHVLGLLYIQLQRPLSYLETLDKEGIG